MQKACQTARLFRLREFQGQKRAFLHIVSSIAAAKKSSHPAGFFDSPPRFA